MQIPLISRASQYVSQIHVPQLPSRVDASLARKVTACTSAVFGFYALSQGRFEVAGISLGLAAGLGHYEYTQASCDKADSNVVDLTDEASDVIDLTDEASGVKEATAQTEKARKFDALNMSKTWESGVKIPRRFQEHARSVITRDLGSSYIQSRFRAQEMGRLLGEDISGEGQSAWVSEGILDLYIPMLRKECSESQWIFPRCLGSTYKQLQESPERLERFRERSLKNLLTQREYDEQGKYQSTRTALPDPAKLKTIWLPVNHHNSHWYFIEIDLAGREYKIFDSKPGIADHEEGVQVAEWLVEQMALGGYINLDREERFESSEAPIQKQQNGHDCGVYMLRGIEERMKGKKIARIGKNVRQQLLNRILKYDKQLSA